MSDRHTTNAYNWMPITSQTIVDTHETATGERLSFTNINRHDDPVHTSSVENQAGRMNSLDPTRLDSPLAALHHPADAPFSVTDFHAGYPGDSAAPWDGFNTAATAPPHPIAAPGLTAALNSQAPYHTNDSSDFDVDAKIGNKLDFDFNTSNDFNDFHDFNHFNDFNDFNDLNKSNNFSDLKDSDFGFEFDFSVYPAGTSGDSALDPFAPRLGDPTFSPVAIAAPPIRAAAPPPRPRHHCAQCMQSFTRTGDLTRHQRNHNPNSHRYACPFPNCTRVGNKGFLRVDKLMDHRRRMRH